MADSELLVRAYYAAFNERRLADAAACFGPAAVLDQLPMAHQQPGPQGYLEFAEHWLRAFPDAALTVDSISSPDAVTHNVELTMRGTHEGPFEFGGRTFRAKGARAALRIRELLQIERGRIVFASLSFDVQEIIRQLATVDTSTLLHHLQRLKTLADELADVRENETRARDVVDRIGRELDTARQIVRPYFK